MKLRILDTMRIILFITLGAIGGHYQGLSQGTIWGYQQLIGDMQQKVALTYGEEKKK